MRTLAIISLAAFASGVALYLAAVAWVSDPIVDPQAMPPGPLQEIYR